MSKIFNLIKPKSESEPAILQIFGEIGENWWTMDGITSKEFRKLLDEIPREQEIRVDIDSPGGSVSDGLAIYTMLQARKDKVVCRVYGQAASIASVIACAGRETLVPENAMWMVHKPWATATGNSDDFRQFAEALDTHERAMVAAYRNRTGMSEDQIHSMLSEETWMTGKEAAAYGFCTCVEPMQMAASLAQPKHYRFRNAPKQAATAACAPTNNKTDAMKPDENQTPVATPPEIVAAATTITTNDQPAAAVVATINAAVRPEPIAPPTATATAPFAPSRIENLGNPALEQYRGMSPGSARAEFRKQNMRAIMDAGLNTDEARALIAAASRMMSPVATNTIASGLVNDVLIDSFTSVAVHNRLAPLDAILRQFDAVPMKPKTPVDVRKATAASTTLTDASDFEQGNGTLDVLNIVPVQFTQPFQMSNDDLQKGSRLEYLAEINVNAFADAISDATTTLMTAANFGSTTLVVGVASSWTSASLQAKLAPILAAGKNYDRTVLLLDGGHLAYLLPVDRNSFALRENGGWGFDSIIPNSRWTGAQSNACGFVSNGQAIVGIAGPPVEVAPGMFQSTGTASLKNGLTVAVKTWYSLKTRTIWASYDVVYGAGVIDSTAGRVLITS